jgi:hypothetical protein
MRLILEPRLGVIAVRAFLILVLAPMLQLSATPLQLSGNRNVRASGRPFDALFEAGLSVTTRLAGPR